jgi:hypothetical protein
MGLAACQSCGYAGDNVLGALDPLSGTAWAAQLRVTQERRRPLSGLDVVEVDEAYGLAGVSARGHGGRVGADG